MAKNNRVINTASVKVQFMTSSKDFTATMAAYWVAINEMADKRLILQNNLRVCHEWAELKKNEPEKQAEYLADAEKYQAEFDAFKEEYNKRINACYNLLTDKLYTAYTTSEDSFKEAIKDWFKTQNIEATPTLISFMVMSVGLRNTSNKKFFETGNTKSYVTEKSFKNNFMRGLCQLMKDKNALKTDAYKYQYVVPKKTKDKTEAKLKKLRNMTVANGASQQEEETARKIIAKLEMAI